MLIEHHVIRSEVPGIVIDPIAVPATASGEATLRVASEMGLRWRSFVERFVAEARFDDPGQPQPRSGGTGWIRVPLPLGLYINLYRSSGSGLIGAQVRFTGAEANAAFAELLAERENIDLEFAAAGFAPPAWGDGEVPMLGLTRPSPAPWDETAEAAQRAWMARAANQLVNSLRPRLEPLDRDLAA